MRLPLLVLHIGAGVLAMFAGAAAMSFRKGSRWHGRAGSVFVAAMLSMAVAASFLAYMKHQPNNVFGGLDYLYGFHLAIEASTAFRLLTPLQIVPIVAALQCVGEFSRVFLRNQS